MIYSVILPHPYNYSLTILIRLYCKNRPDVHRIYFKKNEMKEIKKESSTRRTNGCFYLLSVQVDEYSEYEASMLTKVQVYTLWCYGRIFFIESLLLLLRSPFLVSWLVLMFVHWYNVHVYASLHKLIKQDSAVLFNNIVRYTLHT